MVYCEECGLPIFNYEQGRHRCPDAYRVWSIEDGEEEGAEIILAGAAWDAAEKWGASFDQGCGDYPLVRGESIAVIVEHEKSGARKKFIVSGEMVPEYNAQELPDEASQ